jgi:transcriptional regulator of arginine metabolism
MPSSSAPSSKRDRHRVILEIVESEVVGSQEELRRRLLERGWDVAQSTLSRDLHELRLARVPTDDGMRYAGTEQSAEMEQGRLALESLLPQLFDRIDGVGELVVLHTVPGGAQPVAAAFDAAGWPDVLGTVGGDDTILIVCRSGEAREQVIRRIRQLARG